MKNYESLAGERELYNLDADHLERINLADEEPSRTSAMSRLLHDWVERHLEGGRRDPMRIW